MKVPSIKDTLQRLQDTMSKPGLKTNEGWVEDAKQFLATQMPDDLCLYVYSIDVSIQAEKCQMQCKMLKADGNMCQKKVSAHMVLESAQFFQPQVHAVWSKLIEDFGSKGKALKHVEDLNAGTVLVNAFCYCSEHAKKECSWDKLSPSVKKGTKLNPDAAPMDEEFEGESHVRFTHCSSPTGP